MIVFMGGGLGNQMFEYAYARALQEEHGINICFNSCELNYHSYEGRKFGLDKLSVDSNKISVSNDILKYAIFKLKKKGYLNSKDFKESMDKSGFLDKRGFLISLDTYKYYEHVVNNKVKYMYGNFQSWKYFEKYDGQICKELHVIEKQSEQNKRLQQQIEKENSVCVHIRRGDYVNNENWKQLNVCSYAYYLQSMRCIASKVENPVFYIFSNDSNDIHWIKKNYDFSVFKTKYVDLNNPDYEELRLMYSCKHFIISNSTFSWWAQHLADNKNKIVIAPSVWNSQENASDIYEKNWKVINI